MARIAGNIWRKIRLQNVNLYIYIIGSGVGVELRILNLSWLKIPVPRVIVAVVN